MITDQIPTVRKNIIANIPVWFHHMGAFIVHMGFFEAMNTSLVFAKV